MFTESKCMEAYFYTQIKNKGDLQEIDKRLAGPVHRFPVAGV